MSLLHEAKPHLEMLGAKNREFSQLYPGEPAARQPVHTVYGGAHLYREETTRRLGELAIESMREYGAGAVAFARAVGFVDARALEGESENNARASYQRDPGALRRERPALWLALTVYDRVLGKLAREPVEDFRIDFEDGFGVRSDGEEDEAAVQTARELARGFANRSLPPFTGIRIKSLGEEWKARSARTLELFLESLVKETGGRVPDNFVVTLPKVTIAEQARTLVRLFEILEARLGLKAGALRMEIMIETTQALFGPDGRSPLLRLLDACEGRCVGAHLGTYDFTASCNITAAHQVLDHPLCDLAKAMMTLAYAGTGIFLSDGATNVLPVEVHRGQELEDAQRRENMAAVHAAWRLSQRHIRHSLVGGFYQGWDLHPAQLPVRYATCYAFFLEGFAQAAERLKSFVDRAAQATLVGDVFDDAATAQGLLNYFLRALNCGAIDIADVAQTGLTREEVNLRSFPKILEQRRARGD
jgi:citrate lyase beta subunit